MFRELVRKNKQIPAEECIALLTKETRGVLSVNGDDGYPYGMPMNHFYNPKTGVFTALILLAYVLSENQYSPFAIVMVYAGLAGLAIGIFGGFYTIVSNRTVDNKPDTEEQK